MPKYLIPLLAALTLPLSVRGASSSDLPLPLVQEVTVRASERGMPAQEALALITEAAKRGLPPDWVAAKVLEGLSKNVPPARISAVARDLINRLSAADEILTEAHRAGLAPESDHRAALLDLSAAAGAGVDRQAMASLITSARQARSGNVDSVVSGAHAIGALTRRGVPVSEALSLGQTIARKGPRLPNEIPALFEAWRAEGGKEVRHFVNEATRRIEHGHPLEGMVDRFGDSPHRVVNERGPDKDQKIKEGEADQDSDRDRDRNENWDRSSNRSKDRDGLIGSDVGKHGADQGIGPGERPGHSGGAVPGLDDATRGKARGKGPKPKR